MQNDFYKVDYIAKKNKPLNVLKDISLTGPHLLGDQTSLTFLKASSWVSM